MEEINLKRSHKELRMQAKHFAKRNKICGLHCIKMKDISVKAGNSYIIEKVNVHIHCGISPKIALMSVDLPAPFLPIITVNFPQ